MTSDFLNLAKAEASVRPYFDKPDHLNSDGGHDAEYQISSLFHYRDNIGRKNYRLLNLLRHLPSVVIKKKAGILKRGRMPTLFCPIIPSNDFANILN